MGREADGPVKFEETSIVIECAWLLVERMYFYLCVISVRIGESVLYLVLLPSGLIF